MSFLEKDSLSLPSPQAIPGLLRLAQTSGMRGMGTTPERRVGDGKEKKDFSPFFYFPYVPSPSDRERLETRQALPGEKICCSWIIESHETTHVMIPLSNLR